MGREAAGGRGGSRYGWRGNGFGVEVYEKGKDRVVARVETGRGAMADRWAAREMCEALEAGEGAGRERALRKSGAGRSGRKGGTEWRARRVKGLGVTEVVDGRGRRLVQIPAAGSAPEPAIRMAEDMNTRGAARERAMRRRML